MKNLLAVFDGWIEVVHWQRVGAMVGVQIGSNIESAAFSVRVDHQVGVQLAATSVKCPSVLPNYFGEMRGWAGSAQVGKSGKRNDIAYEWVNGKSFRAISQLPMGICELEFATHKL